DNKATSNTLPAITSLDETGTMSLLLFNDEIESDGFIPTEITNLIGNKYAFKVAIDDYNDLESQTDENTTPNEKQKTNKRPAKGEPGSESSTRKKKVVEIKVEKDA
nr:hypothetical protein [Tanacetum cinerariifolium]